MSPLVDTQSCTHTHVLTYLSRHTNKDKENTVAHERTSLAHRTLALSAAALIIFVDANCVHDHLLDQYAITDRSASGTHVQYATIHTAHTAVSTCHFKYP